MILGLASGLGSGCFVDEERVTVEAFYDRPQTIPEGVPYEARDQVSADAEIDPDECPRGRGIDSEGNCVMMVTRAFDNGRGGLVQVPGGDFWRGDLPPPTRLRSAEDAVIQWAGQPLKTDHVDSFWMDGWEISRGAYADCVSVGECSEARCLDGGDGTPTEVQLEANELEAFPQTCVTHSQAAGYCEWRDARLPTEAEWEYAARGPLGWVYPWGNEFRDELGLAMGPVGFDPMDISYFGLKGFGGNALEWTAEVFDDHVNMRAYLEGEFRSADGPVASHVAAFNRSLCADGSACALGERYVVKGGRSGARSGAWEFRDGVALAEDLPAESVEGDRTLAQHRRLGFRCARDLEDDQPPLAVPESAQPLPVVITRGDYQLFMVFAEAVDRSEAERFCTQLMAPGEAPGTGGWRLPSLEEIELVSAWFGGPGPFWTRDGAVEQTYVDRETAEYANVSVDDDAPLFARCIRNSVG